MLISNKWVEMADKPWFNREQPGFANNKIDAVLSTNNKYPYNHIPLLNPIEIYHQSWV